MKDPLGSHMGDADITGIPVPGLTYSKSRKYPLLFYALPLRLRSSVSTMALGGVLSPRTPVCATAFSGIPAIVTIPEMRKSDRLAKAGSLMFQPDLHLPVLNIK
ncbi:hypothetical protein TNCV_2222681 [Trichonephila clavipes]|nr:hypothetical protein TNCV_2222681 [Trichonephila clavipes]